MDARKLNGHGLEDLPLIEKESFLTGAVDGYEWYIVRDWRNVYLGMANAVSFGAMKGPQFPPDELLFSRDEDELLLRRDPAYPGEPSYVMLPVGYEVPHEVAIRKAGPVPLGPLVASSGVPLRLIEDANPEERREGYRAYSFVHPHAAYSGTVTDISADFGVLIVVKHISIRPLAYAGEASRLWVPDDITVPPKLLE